MNIQLGIYDIFSRIFPGAFYLFAFIEFARVMNLIKFDWMTLKDIGLLPLLGLALIAYIVGVGMDRIGSAWHQLFKKDRASQEIIREFKEEHKNQWSLTFEDVDWPILRAYLYVHNPDVANEIDRHNALCLMLQNLSLGLVLIAVSEGIQFAITMNWIFLIVVAALIFLSYQMVIQAGTWKEWFYRSIFEAIISYQVNLKQAVKPVRSTATQKKARR